MRVRLWLLHAILLHASPCAVSGQAFTGELETVALTLERQYQLDESIGLLGDITGSAVTAEGQLVLSSPQGGVVYLHDRDGHQIRRIGTFGRGPGEFTMPYRVRVYGDDIYVFEAMALKILRFDIAGAFIEQYDGFTEAITNFEVADNRLVLYLVGGFRSQYIAVLDTDSERFIGVYGDRTNTHDVLTRWGDSGGTARRGNSIFYVSPSETVVHVLDLDTRTTAEVSFNDAQFVQAGVDYTIRETDRPIWQEYYDHNSRNTGVFDLGPYVLIETENGDWTMRDGKRSDERRVSALHILSTDDGRQLDTIRLGKSFRDDYGKAILAGSSSGKVYYLSERSDTPGGPIRRIVSVFSLGPIVR